MNLGKEPFMVITTESNAFSDLAMPTIPPRSRLHHLEPVGVETSEVESVTSFIVRLAATHHISVAALYEHEFLPLLRELRDEESNAAPTWMQLSSIYTVAKILNGLNSTAAQGARVLETLTLRSNLHFLTCVPWGTSISNMLLVRKLPAWCPKCYDEWQRTEEIIHTPLSWALNAVTVCLRHRCLLSQLCPRCNRTSHFLSHNSRAGCCTRCQFWLGYSGDVSDDGIEQDNMRNHLWAAKVVGEWIEEVQRLRTLPRREDTTCVIVKCIERLADGNANAFARLASVGPSVVYAWQAGRAVPRLDHLLRICSTLEVSLVDLLTGRCFNQEGFSRNISLTERIQRSFVGPKRDSEQIRQILEGALEEEPAPSLHDIAKRHGYKGTDCLRYVSSDLCKKITERYKLSENEKRLPNFQKLCDDETVLSELERALEPECPPPFTKIAANLGYKSGISLHQRFPAICKLITAKRATYEMKRLSRWRTALRTALKEVPPPSFHQVIKRLEHLHVGNIRNQLPELCRAIIDRYAEWESARQTEVMSNLRAALAEELPRPLEQIASHYGYLTNDLRKRYPEWCRLIVDRYAAYRRKSSEEKKRLFREEIRRVVLDLYTRGIYPTQSMVRPLLENAPITNLAILTSTLRELRRELGLRKVDSTSFANA